MRIDILTLFPQMFESPMQSSILGRAQDTGFLRLVLWDIRDFSESKHRVVDDSPYGGGAGMVLKPDVVVPCIEHVKTINRGPVVFLTPQGERFVQRRAVEFAELDEFVLLCGHYEGLDERVRQGWVDYELSVGDFVLTGGELAAMLVVDAVVRLVPGVLGCGGSAKADSFASGLLEHPHYTRPVEYRGMQVPDVLLSGHHEQIRRWRLAESLRRTRDRRPDLLDQRLLTKEETRLLSKLLDSSL